MNVERELRLEIASLKRSVDKLEDRVERLERDAIFTAAWIRALEGGPEHPLPREEK